MLNKKDEEITMQFIYNRLCMKTTLLAFMIFLFALHVFYQL